MSATLTWFSSGLGTKTGTTAAALMDDVETLMNSKSGDANFSWQVASKNNSVDPRYLVMKRKDGSAGRILLIHYTSAPGAGAYNATLFGTVAPAANSVYMAWFPNGNTDTPSNLGTTSGTIMGNDTDAVRGGGQCNILTVYTTSIAPFYFDSTEALVLGLGQTGNANAFFMGAGKLVVDANDDAYDATLCPGTQGSSSMVSNSSPTFAWSNPATNVTSNTTTSHLKVNYGGGNNTFFAAFAPSGPWTQQTVGSNDVLTDTPTNRAWFVPFPLLGWTKGQGFILKLRQIAFGPTTTAAFQQYSSTGPVIQARQFNPATAGGSGPWFTNFKL